MEIKYKRSYAPSAAKRYSVGEINAALGCAMEIADPRVRLREGRLMPGEVCVMLFGITPEEYAWRDEDAKSLDALAERLRKGVPADRLIGWRICDLKGAQVQRSVQPETGESVDGGAYAAAIREKRSNESGPMDAELIACARMQKTCREAGASVTEVQKSEWATARRAAGVRLMGLERLYAADDAGMNGRYPSICFDERIEIFTTKSRAERACAQIKKSNGGVEVWSVRVLERDEVAPYLRRCIGDGLRRLRVDNGFAAAELEFSDILSAAATENAPLRAMMLREIQYGLRWQRLKAADAPEPNQRGALESMLSMRNFAWREIGNASLYLLCKDGDDRSCVAVTEKVKGTRMLAAFTEELRAVAFAERTSPDSLRAVAMSFDEIAKRCESCERLLIDVDALNYFLPRSEFDKVRELRENPPQMVRIQPPKPEPTPVLRKTELGELPNPDECESAVRPEAPVEAPVEADAPENVPESVGKKSFFRRLFGK